MAKMTLSIGFIMWDKIGPVWKLSSFLSEEGLESQRLELTFMLGMFTF